MQTAKQCRAHAKRMDDAMDNSSNATVIAECRRIAEEWRDLAVEADLETWHHGQRHHVTRGLL